MTLTLEMQYSLRKRCELFADLHYATAQIMKNSKKIKKKQKYVTICRIILIFHVWWQMHTTSVHLRCVVVV